MLCFVQTDAECADPEAELRRASAASFERITVDGQQSTNDMVLLQATGEAGEALPEGLLDAVLLQLALEIVADGEGASRVGRVEVTGAADADEAERVARAIANSPLVKTALYGRDPNWGRIAQAAGMALAGEELDELGPDRIDADSLGSAETEAEIAVELGRGRRPRPRLLLRPHPRLRPAELGVHDVTANVETLLEALPYIRRVPRAHRRHQVRRRRR